MWESWRAQVCSDLHTHTPVQCPQRHSGGGWRKNVDDCMFSLPNRSLMLDPLRRHYQRRRGQPGGFKVTSQSTGVRAPSVNRRQELARCGAHGECYLLVIVVVILCPVWQRINEQHANTFCPNICDRHIFRPASKKLGKKRKKRWRHKKWNLSSCSTFFSSLSLKFCWLTASFVFFFPHTCQMGATFSLFDGKGIVIGLRSR